MHAGIVLGVAHCGKSCGCAAGSRNPRNWHVIGVREGERLYSQEVWASRELAMQQAVLTRDRLSQEGKIALVRWIVGDLA